MKIHSHKLLISSFQQYGIGTLWVDNSLADSDAAPCNYTLQSRASGEYQALSGCTTAIPLEQTGGAGTACGHWAEDCLVDELMTGFATGTTQPLSRMTIASLEDLGYTVDYNQADPYAVSNLDPACVCSAALQADGIIQQSEDKKVSKLGEGTPLRQGSKRRAASDGVLQQAIVYGQKILAERKSIKESFQSTSNIAYVGDRVISVLYIEDGLIYSVEVKPDA